MDCFCCLTSTNSFLIEICRLMMIFKGDPTITVPWTFWTNNSVALDLYPCCRGALKCYKTFRCCFLTDTSTTRNYNFPTHNSDFAVAFMCSAHKYNILNCLECTGMLYMYLAPLLAFSLRHDHFQCVFSVFVHSCAPIFPQATLLGTLGPGQIKPCNDPL